MPFMQIDADRKMKNCITDLPQKLFLLLYPLFIIITHIADSHSFFSIDTKASFVTLNQIYTIVKILFIYKASGTNNKKNFISFIL